MAEELKELAVGVLSSAKLLDVNFVEPFPKEVQTECYICLYTLKHPYIVSCCGYRFCKSCLKSSMESCPLCKREWFDKLPDRQLERLLNERPVFCLLQDNGCDWTGELAKLSSHLSFRESSSELACQHLPVPCYYCGGHFKRADLPGHQEVCDSRPTQCSYCTLNYPYKDMASHREICPKAPRSCKNKCSDRLFTEEELHSHLANDCPLVVVPCKYLFAGCEENLMRKEMKAHEESHMEEHLSLVTPICTQLVNMESRILSALQIFRKEAFTLTTRLYAAHIRFNTVTEDNRKIKKEINNCKKVYLMVTNLPPAAKKRHFKRRFGFPDYIVYNQPGVAYIYHRCTNNYEEIMKQANSGGIKLLGQKLALEFTTYPL